MKAFFLDRDGVLNHDKGYTYKIEDLKFIDGVFEFIREIKIKKFLIIVVSNQSGVAKGLFRPLDVKKFNEEMNKKILTKTGYKIDRFYFCPYHEDGKINRFKKKTDFRKPGNKMIEKAINDFKIIRNDSFVIGDKEIDISSAKKSKIKSFLFNEKNIFKFYKNKIEKFLNN